MVDSSEQLMYDIRHHRIAENIGAILSELDVKFTDTNFQGTPQRVATYLLEFMADPTVSPSDILQPRFKEEYREMVIVKDINFVALCAHHLLPFRGTAAVGYIPNGEVVGLSKLARLVHYFAHRMTLQERVTKQIADALEAELHPMGVMVVLSGTHECMSIRGVHEPNSHTITSAVTGVFLDNTKSSKNEFLSFIGVR